MRAGGGGGGREGREGGGGGEEEEEEEEEDIIFIYQLYFLDSFLFSTFIIVRGSEGNKPVFFQVCK